MVNAQIPGSFDPDLPQPAATARPSTRETGEALLALTRLISHWSSQDMQRSVIGASGVSLDPVAVRALYLLGISQGESTPSKLADELHLSRPSTSKLIARLESVDLIARNASPRDRRSVSIGLSPRGREIFEELFGAGIAMITAATLDWDPDELRTFTALLPRFVAGLLATPPQ